MTTPATAILDDYNRVNEGPPPSASWGGVIDSAFGGLKVDTNACLGDTAGFNDSYWDANIGPVCEVYATVAVRPTTEFDSMWIYLRVQGEGTANPDGYIVRWFTWDAHNDAVDVHRVDNAVWTQLGADFDQEIAAGEKLLLRASGSTLDVHHYTGGTWSLLGTRSDATYAAAGKLGLGIQRDVAKWDDFGGGTLQPIQLRATTVPHMRQWQPGVTR